MKKLIVNIGVSKKTGNKYTGLSLYTGYRYVQLSWDSNLCAELLGVSVQSLFDMDTGKYEVVIE